MRLLNKATFLIFGCLKGSRGENTLTIGKSDGTVEVPTGTLIIESCGINRWPDTGKACGGCRIVIDDISKYKTCENYCKQRGRSCLGAWGTELWECKTETMEKESCSTEIDVTEFYGVCECDANAETTVTENPTDQTESTSNVATQPTTTTTTTRRTTTTSTTRHTTTMKKKSKTTKPTSGGDTCTDKAGRTFKHMQEKRCGNGCKKCICKNGKIWMDGDCGHVRNWWDNCYYRGRKINSGYLFKGRKCVVLICKKSQIYRTNEKHC